MHYIAYALAGKDELVKELIKECITYFNYKYLLICDKGKIMFEIRENVFLVLYVFIIFNS